MSRLEQQVCGAVDNTSALPTAPQTQQQQQKRRTYDSLLKADICTRYRHCLDMPVLGARQLSAFCSA